MKPLVPIVLLVVLAVVVGILFFAPRGPAPATRDRGSAGGARDSGPAARRTAVVPGNADRRRPPRPPGPPRPHTVQLRRVAAAIVPGADPVARYFSRARTAAAGGSAAAAPKRAPRVRQELAFEALRYVGVDPEAEKTWTKAINDPALSAGVRSDLIEDLNDEGYPDPDHLTKKDLPLILARLEIVERLAPYAMDKVNADAFEEAYKDLLNMYLGLGGKPRK